MKTIEINLLFVNTLEALYEKPTATQRAILNQLYAAAFELGSVRERLQQNLGSLADSIKREALRDAATPGRSPNSCGVIQSRGSDIETKVGELAALRKWMSSLVKIAKAEGMLDADTEFLF